MSNEEHARLRERLDLYVDGSLPAAERETLEQHLASCAGCRGAQEALERLRNLLATVRVTVRPGFAQAVMAAVTAERPAVARPVSLAAALVGLLALVSATLFAVAGAELGGFGLFSTVADFATSTILAGAGLLAASWRGVGMVVQDFLLASVPNLLAGLGLIIALNALAFRLVRSRRAATARERQRKRP